MRELPCELHTWMDVGGDVDFSRDKVISTAGCLAASEFVNSVAVYMKLRSRVMA